MDTLELLYRGFHYSEVVCTQQSTWSHKSSLLEIMAMGRGGGGIVKRILDHCIGRVSDPSSQLLIFWKTYRLGYMDHSGKARHWNSKHA